MRIPAGATGVLYDPDRLASAMSAAGLDALVATTPVNVQYLARYRKVADTLAVVFGSEPARPTLIVPNGAVDFWLDDPSSAVDVVVYGTFYRHTREGGQLSAGEALIADLHHASRTDTDKWGLLAERVAEAGPTGAVIGVDCHPQTLAAMRHELPSVELHDATGLFRGLRSIKTAEEIARLSIVARITEAGIHDSARQAALGVTQRQLAREFRRSISDADALLRSDNVSIDGGAALGNVNVPTDTVRDGSVIRYDVGAFDAGYASDISRCFVFGAPDPRAIDLHHALVEGQERALATIAAGVKASEVFHAGVAGVRDAGIGHYERTHVGHGIGIAGAGYDAPLLSPNDDTPLAAGMVLCVETPYYELGYAGLQVEDMVVVETTGYRFLTHTRRELQLLP